MKKIPTILVFFSSTCIAQDVQFDAINNLRYASIQPIHVGWVKGNPAANRLCISNFTLAKNVSLIWELQYPLDTFYNFKTVAKGTITLPVDNQDISIKDACTWIFKYIGDSVLNIDYLSTSDPVPVTINTVTATLNH